MNTVLVRNEEEKDYAVVEKIIREAFWNLYVPGCDEHYLAHILRNHPDFIPELDLVIELDGQVIGSVMYTKAQLIDENGNHKGIITFGPVAIAPEFQRKGYGKILLEHSFEKAIDLGYDVIVIMGSPENYVGRGFVSCKKHNICMEGGIYPFAMLAKELKAGALDGRKWVYHESPAYNVNPEEAKMYDQQFPVKEKKHQPSQEVFYIQSRSVIQ